MYNIVNNDKVQNGKYVLICTKSVKFYLTLQVCHSEYTWHLNDVFMHTDISHNDVIILMSEWCKDIIESQK